MSFLAALAAPVVGGLVSSLFGGGGSSSPVSSAVNNGVGAAEAAEMAQGAANENVNEVENLENNALGQTSADTSTSLANFLALADALGGSPALNEGGARTTIGGRGGSSGTTGSGTGGVPNYADVLAALAGATPSGAGSTPALEGPQGGTAATTPSGALQENAGEPVYVGVPGMPGSDPSYQVVGGQTYFNGNSANPSEAVAGPSLASDEQTWQSEYGSPSSSAGSG